MNREEYREYLHSDHWLEISHRVKHERMYCCEICGNKILAEVIAMLLNPQHSAWDIPEFVMFAHTVHDLYGDKNRIIQIHHRNYNNLGKEKDCDLACVCAPCHVLLTENTKNNDLDKAWERTHEIVKKLIKQMNNHIKIDDEYNFMSVMDYYDVIGATIVDEEIEEQIEDKLNWCTDFFTIEDEFN